MIDIQRKWSAKFRSRQRDIGAEDQLNACMLDLRIDYRSASLSLNGIKNVVLVSHIHENDMIYILTGTRYYNERGLPQVTIGL